MLPSEIPHTKVKATAHKVNVPVLCFCAYQLYTSRMVCRRKLQFSVIHDTISISVGDFRKNRSDLVLRPNFGVLDLICINFSSDNKRSVLDQNFGLISGLRPKLRPKFGLRPKLIWTIRSDRHYHNAKSQVFSSYL